MSGTAEAPGGAERPGEKAAQDDGVTAAGPRADVAEAQSGAPAAGDDGSAATQVEPAAAAPGAERPAADRPGGADAAGTPAGHTPEPQGTTNGVEPVASDGPGAGGAARPGMSADNEAPSHPGRTDGAGSSTVAPGTEPADDAAAEPPDPALLAEGARIAEALIFASDRPVTPAMLGAVLPPGVTAGAVVAALAAACEGRGVAIAEVAGGWAFRTAPDLAQRLTKVVQAPRRLPRAAMEALSIIAYHQPCTRGEIEEIRGAALAQTTLEALLELGLVAPRGRREVPGRPTLWGTTPKFLEQFGLKALSDLPRKEELVTAETGPALPLAATAPTAPEAEAAAAEEAEPTDADGAPGTPPGA